MGHITYRKEQEYKMSSYDFEVRAKKELMRLIEEEYGEVFRIEDISVVWMAHLLRNKKAVFVDNGKNQRLYEVTYNVATDEMYVDMYEKRRNVAIRVGGI